MNLRDKIAQRTSETRHEIIKFTTDNGILGLSPTLSTGRVRLFLARRDGSYVATKSVDQPESRCGPLRSFVIERGFVDKGAADPGAGFASAVPGAGASAASSRTPGCAS